MGYRIESLHRSARAGGIEFNTREEEYLKKKTTKDGIKLNKMKRETVGRLAMSSRIVDIVRSQTDQQCTMSPRS